MFEDVPCKSDPRAPHGFMRDASHTLGRYVCECESWSGAPLEKMSEQKAEEFASSVQKEISIPSDDIIRILRAVEDFYEIR